MSPLSGEPAVQLVKPEIRDLKLVVGQPSFVDAYEQTSIYAKLAGFVKSWNVDIGDKVKKDQLLATLFIPELEQELNQKKAQVGMDRALIEQAKKLVEVADGNLKAADAQVAQAKANVGKYVALVERWTSEVKRQTAMVREKVIDKQVLDESQRQLESSVASREESLAGVQTAQATRIARAADLAKSKVDVDVAQAKLGVSQADEQRVAALYSYTQLTAPYDGIVIVRNVNTGDFVLPATGDPSASPRTPDQSAARAAPPYVVARTDKVRVYVDIPEKSANFVVSQVSRQRMDPRPVTQAIVRVAADRDVEIPALVTRSAWALNVKTRTLRAEIDLPNTDEQLLPGMYAYGMVTFNRDKVRVLPRSAVEKVGNTATCYLYEDGKAVKTALQVAPGDRNWIEVKKKQVNGEWENFTGNEEVILGDLSELTDGGKVRVVK